jgi:processive 1,2-diacylglycerol beta-glucosyltransferase
VSPGAAGRRAAPRILILSAPYGAGHARAAEAVARAFAAEGAQVEVLDHFVSFLPPAFVRSSLAMFWGILRFTPGLWGLAYEFSARIGPRSPAMAGMDRIGAAGLLRHLERTRPDAVVHVHPTPAGAMASLRARGATQLPHGIVFTDFSAHPQWIHAGLERYFVPTEAVRAGVVAQGIAADRVVTSGLPVDASFITPPDRPALRAAMGLAADVPVALVTGGMRGLLRGVAEACEALASLDRPFVALAVCGDHLRLAAWLRRRHWRDSRFRVLGHVTDMARLMGVADLVVSKAGAMTCAEALALGRPLLLHRSLPGQEQANEAGLVAAGAALRARGARELRRRLDALLGEPDLRTALAATARNLRRPEAGRTVAKEMLAVLERE